MFLKGDVAVPIGFAFKLKGIQGTVKRVCGDAVGVWMYRMEMLVKGSLEVKLPTIWRIAEVGRVREEKSRSGKIREEKE